MTDEKPMKKANESRSLIGSRTEIPTTTGTEVQGTPRPPTKKSKR
jgi:hypothetical protein